MNQTIDILCRARGLYASAPSHAESGEFPMMGTYCVVYAVDRAASEDRDSVETVLNAFERTMGTGRRMSCVQFNAEHSTEEVLAAFDRAIAAEGLRVPPLQRTERTVPVLAGQES